MQASVKLYRFLKSNAVDPCAPWSVAPEDRCAYVIEHHDSCYPDGGWQVYLRYHYCTFEHWQWLSLLLLLAAAVVTFFMLTTISERFFCPAVELISEYLRLPPVVAGATLLSFGNGAPDIFTQVAAVGQGGSASVGMALAEPLGGSLFASNIVFGCVVLVAHRMGNVHMQRLAFIKDVSFLLVAICLIMALLFDQKMEMWEAGLMVLLYATYVCLTFYISRHDEPVHADVARHEVPQQEGVDFNDSCSEGCQDGGTPSVAGVSHGQQHQLASLMGQAGVSHKGEQPPPICATNGVSPPPAVVTGRPAAAVASAPQSALLRPPSLKQQPSRSLRQHSSSSDLQQPLLAAEETAAAAAIEDSAFAVPMQLPSVSAVQSSSRMSCDTSSVGGGNSAAVDRLPSPASHLTVNVPPAPHAPVAAEFGGSAKGSRGQGIPRAQADDQLPSAPGVDGGLPLHSTGSMPSAQSSSPEAAPINPRVLRSFKTFSEGMRIVIPSGLEAELDSFNSAVHRSADRPPSPRQRSEGGMTPYSAKAGQQLPVFMPGTPAAAAAAAAASESSRLLVPLVQQLQEQHQAEQQDLLLQQQEEHVALLLQHDEAVAAARSTYRMAMLRVQQPFVQVISCTMPRVGTGPGHHYQRWRACLLPFTAFLPFFLAQPDLVFTIGSAGLVFGALCAAVGAAVIYGTYPSSNMPRKTLKGVFAVMTFCQAIIWLNVSANALVQVTVLLGVIFGVEPAVLGATVLAWGNSAPDLMNNLALARDGFPSMSVAACFASPLFTLLVGMGSALAYGCAMNHGVLAVPVDGTLRVMVGFCALNLLKYLVAVPLLYKFKMTRLMAYLAFLFYAVYNVVYGLTLSGLINIDGWMVGSR